jgi:hypothetical protein
MATITLRRPLSAPLNQNMTLVGASTGARYGVNQFGEATVDTTDKAALLALGWSPLAGGATHATSGTGTVDFGAFPGSDFAAATITASDPDDPSAILFAYVLPTATVDHSADEHLVDPPQVSAVNNGDGTITVNAVPRQASYPSLIPPEPMPYGKWTVGYAFLQ